MKFNDFYVTGKLGSGSFGTAFLVKLRLNPSKRYVIKIQNNTFSKVFDNESNLLMRLRHPNIIAFKNFWREDNRNFILMEYATHGTLGDRLKNRTMKEEEGLYFLCQIVLGVSYIHKKLVLHRDLKPANLLLTGSEGNILKIADFGISKDVSRDVGKTSIGTEIYMAPEVLQGYTYGTKCDIWSIGIIFYEMLTKSWPFNVKNRLEMLRQICNGKQYSLPFGLVSQECTILSKKLLMVNPAHRPSAGDLLKSPLLTAHICRVYLNIGKSLYEETT